MDIEVICKEVIGACIEVHRRLGPGLLESAYEACLAHELELRGLQFERQVALPLTYKGVQVDAGYHLDLLIEGALILELKAVERLDPIHLAQTLTYLRVAGQSLALLINFNVPVLKDGIKRVVQDHPDPA
ncbi:MAG TPA: GxxExxY protein [Holophagaceae bacterium]|nr:GxxExxY protein [Holophagaceae bacterium]